ncbi:MAG: hypothetical protein M1829_000238 [Trizodia sp. TS-e1964]|nr:MAG: hypothetical protein M1829_000238 [Trizodia sp. TS-e1964]
MQPFSFSFYTIGAALGVLLLAKITYNLFFHPLRNVPGPFIAKFTSLWLVALEIAGFRMQTVHALHEKYGPVVRVAPNEVAFADAQAARTIYGQGTPFMKTRYYSVFRLIGLANLFDCTDRDFHKYRRKLLSHTFAKSTIDQEEPIFHKHIETLARWIEKKEGQEMNMLSWFRMLALDTAGSLFFDLDLGALTSDKPHPFLAHIDGHLMFGSLKNLFPTLIPLSTYLPIKSWQYFANARLRIYATAQSALNQYVEKYGRDADRTDLLKRVVKGDLTLKPMSDDQVSSELSSLMIGATDTTGTTLTFSSWILAKNPEWQERVRQEQKDNNIQFIKGVPSYKDIENLPILNAVVSENLRLFPAAAAALPRVTPQGGATISGTYLPGGTTVFMQAYTTQRDPKAFPHPFEYNPRRWLETDGGTPEMKELFMPFSRGPRSCIGLHIAKMQIRMTLSMILHGWQISVGPSTTDETMELREHFIIMPKSGQCNLVFTKLIEQSLA